MVWEAALAWSPAVDVGGKPRDPPWSQEWMRSEDSVVEGKRGPERDSFPGEVICIDLYVEAGVNDGENLR